MGHIIIRRPKKENNIGVGRGYTPIQNELIDDELISNGAFRLMLNLLRLPKNFDFSASKYARYKNRAREKQLAHSQLLGVEKATSLTEITVKRQIKELEKAGYIKKRLIGYIRENNHTKPDFEYEIFENTLKFIE